MTKKRQSAGSGPKSSPVPARQILISAAEPSADLYGALLIRRATKVIPGVEFTGLGGPRMRQAGCRIIGDLTARASMLAGTLGLVGRAWKLLGELDRLMETQPFDLGVVIDSPVLHLPLARRIKRREVPVLYYVAPQTWAWAAYRNRKLARRTDRLAVILPFEEAYFRAEGMRADYVGHPLFDDLVARNSDRKLVAEFRGESRSVVTMLPGSRRQVVREVLPGQLEVCRQVARRFPEARFFVSVAGDSVRGIIETQLVGAGVPIKAVAGKNAELIQAADLVLVASGTSTLEVAYYRKPMIVMYNHSRWLYQLLGRWLIATKYLSLPNIIAGREIVPEYMPYYRTPDPIAARAIELLSTPHRLARMSDALDEMMAPLVRTGASANTARIMAEMLNVETPRR